MTNPDDWRRVDEYHIRTYQLVAIQRAELAAHWLLLASKGLEGVVSWRSVGYTIDDRSVYENEIEKRRESCLTLTGTLECWTPLFLNHVAAEILQYSVASGSVWVPERISVVIKPPFADQVLGTFTFDSELSLDALINRGQYIQTLKKRGIVT